jgi:hypothetical protein
MESVVDKKQICDVIVQETKWVICLETVSQIANEPHFKNRGNVNGNLEMHSNKWNICLHIFH